MLNKVKDLMNYKLHCLDGEIGKVKDFYFEDKTWTIQYLIVNTGNWLIGRQVLISPDAITSMNKEEECFYINLTKSQIEKSPILDSDKPVSKQFLNEYREYFQYPMYPIGIGYGGAWNTLMFIPNENDKEKSLKDIEEENDWNPHLRSINTLCGYEVKALDDEIGHVDDFLIDVETWWINYLEINTKNWLPGRTFIISPKWIDYIKCDETRVYVNLNSDEIKESPEYTSESLLDGDFEKLLHEHYNREGNWLDKAEIKEDIDES